MCALYRSLFLANTVLCAVPLDLSSRESIQNAASVVASDMVKYYTGDRPGDVPGNLPKPYYWWEAGAMFGALIDYWYFTGDNKYNNMTMQAMVHQLGPDNVYQPPNQTQALGNDDQAFWAMAALSAAENKFPEPPAEIGTSWIGVVQGVFNIQAARWDTTTCGGGLKWQVFQYNGGYNYKNTISNGCFFNIGSRLAVYTNNHTYADLAERSWDWASRILFDGNYNFYDGSDDKLNCSELNHLQWSYNAGTWLVGAANMYNYTKGSQLWADRVRGIISGLDIFLKDGIMFEQACEEAGTCNVDQRSFKAYFARWMAMTMVRAPFTRELLDPILKTSAQAAIATCTGGIGTQCGLRWTAKTFDGSTGVGEQMSVLEVVQSQLIDYVPGPATAANGLGSQNPSAGAKSPIGPEDLHTDPITTSDRAQAGAMTVLIVATVLGTVVWMIRSDGI